MDSLLVMNRTPLGVLLLSLLFTLFYQTSDAQIIELHSPIPDSKSYIIDENYLKVLFGIHDISDTPQPTVTIENLSAKGVQMDQLSSVEFIFINLKALSKTMSKMNYCCKEVDVGTPECPTANTFRRLFPDSTMVVPVNSEIANVFEITQPGFYTILLSNCGDQINDATVSARIKVYHNGGYLTESYLPIRSMAACFSIALLILSLAWGALLFHYRASVVALHYVILGLAIAATLYYWNFVGLLQKLYHYGSSPNSLIIFNVFLSAIKTTYCYFLILLLAKGWGITCPSLNKSTWIRMGAIFFVYGGAIINRDLTMPLNSTRGIPSYLMYTYVIIGSVLMGIILYWIFKSLSATVQELEFKKQTEKLQIYRKFIYTLLATIGFVSILLIAQIYVSSLPITQRYHFEWVLTDLSPELLFFILLCLTMWFCKPSKNSRHRLYFTEIPDQEMSEVGTGDVQFRTIGKITPWGNDLQLTEDESDSDDEKQKQLHQRSYDAETAVSETSNYKEAL